MARRPLDHELAALRAEILQPDPPREASAATAPEAPRAASDLERQIEQLAAALSSAADEAGDGIKRYPLVAVAAAFLVGFVAGRNTGRL